MLSINDEANCCLFLIKPIVFVNHVRMSCSRLPSSILVASRLGWYSELPWTSGRDCGKCKYGYYKLEAENPHGCTSCGCHPEGSVDLYCDKRGGVCLCKETVVGKYCDTCQKDHYNITEGCIPCNCDPEGTQPGECFQPNFFDFEMGSALKKTIVKNIVIFVIDISRTCFYYLLEGW